MLKIDVFKPAQDFLEDVPAKHRKQLVAKLMDLRREPYPPAAKALAGYPFFRVRAGDYRIVYAVVADTLNVLLIGKRNDDEIYRQLRRIVG
jgi:mRNA interferase RelE/StbE